MSAIYSIDPNAQLAFAVVCDQLRRFEFDTRGRCRCTRCGRQCTLDGKGPSGKFVCPRLSAQHILSQATREENVYRHFWSVGDLMLIDQRVTMHFGAYP